jgi:hypothetical protein
MNNIISATHTATLPDIPAIAAPDKASVSTDVIAGNAEADAEVLGRENGSDENGLILAVSTSIGTCVDTPVGDIIHIEPGVGDAQGV